MLSGCGEDSNDADTGKPQVVAAFYPLAYVAARVGGDIIDVTNLTSVGGEPHDFTLGVKQTADVGSADLVVFEKGFQPAVDDTVEQAEDVLILDAAEVVGLDRFTGSDNGDLDPHFWQDPLRMAELGDAIAKEMGEVDPANAGIYVANAEQLRADLTALDTAYADGLATCARDTVVVSHDAFGYLSKYDLRLEAIAGLSPDAEPTPGDLSRLKDLIEEEGITTVFSETLVSPALAETLAREAGVRTAVLDPIEGLSDETESEDYLSLMQSNLSALQNANGC